MWNHLNLNSKQNKWALPSLFINMAVPVNFFHLDKAAFDLTGAAGGTWLWLAKN